MTDWNAGVGELGEDDQEHMEVIAWAMRAMADVTLPEPEQAGLVASFERHLRAMTPEGIELALAWLRDVWLKPLAAGGDGS